MYIHIYAEKRTATCSGADIIWIVTSQKCTPTYNWALHDSTLTRIQHHQGYFQNIHFVLFFVTFSCPFCRNKGSKHLKHCLFFVQHRKQHTVINDSSPPLIPHRGDLTWDLAAVLTDGDISVIAVFILQADESSIGDPLLPCLALCNAHYVENYYLIMIWLCVVFLPLVCWGVLRIICLVICKIAAFTEITCSWINYYAIFSCTTFFLQKYRENTLFYFMCSITCWAPISPAEFAVVMYWLSSLLPSVQT